PLAETGLGKVYHAALEATEPGRVFFSDLEPYAPLDGVLSRFIATPIFTGKTKLGVLAFRMPEAGIAAVLDSRLGLGETGETLLVGGDGLLRSDSPFTEGDDRMSAAYAAPSVEQAFASGTVSTARVESWRGMPMMAAAAPVRFLDNTWAVVATIADSEALAPVEQM